MDREQMQRAAQLGVDASKSNNPPPKGPTVADGQGPSLGARAAAWVKETHLSQGPQLAENVRAGFRNGREDFLNTMWGGNLNREPGDVATPTQTQVNQEMGIVPEVDEQRALTQEHTKERGRGR